MVKGHGRADSSPFTIGELRGLLVAVGCNVSIYRVQHWSALQRQAAWQWAVKRHLSAFYSGVRVPPTPPHVQPYCESKEAS